MEFVSTRGQDRTPIERALSLGLASDGGLFLPMQWPRLRPDDFEGADTTPRIAERLLQSFFADSIFAADFGALCDQAFTVQTPLKPLRDGQTSILELFHGPSGAFKDVGANFLATMLAHLNRGATRDTTILVATSGDTGSAVATAFYRRPGFRVIILFPDGRVSARQAHLLSCFGDNIQTLRVAGSFDDCQAMAKAALADQTLVQALNMTSANSISLGRLLPQMSYYAEAALRYFRAHGEPLNVVIPSGNLGNALACLIARQIGLPIGRVLISTNANAVLANYVHTGNYQAAPTKATIANAMDVGAPSNIERLIYLAKHDPSILRDLDSVSVPDDAICARIQAFYQTYGEIICPHTATAAEMLAQRRAAGDHAHYAVVATAHPAKFADVVEPLLGLSVPIPECLKPWLARPAQAAQIGVGLDALKAALGP
ncbi:threonine synthase [Ahniella affigens]|uniref:Threonine synthase n=1 Tax=Ahniella affigens TaxID=2021234 RepID=A0A2P1PP63_9GAMM|nr:threonine synthase [Ahniella affigens]AVP96616.1 threonine synthase [Ahniella affigens]